MNARLATHGGSAAVRPRWGTAPRPPGALGSQSHDYAWKICSASRVKSVTSNVSPRAWGSRPAATAAALAAVDDPASPARAVRNILRRWANAASMTANTWSRVAVVAGGRRRLIATRPDSTFGTGQKTVGDTVPALVAVAYQATLTDGTP